MDVKYCCVGGEALSKSEREGQEIYTVPGKVVTSPCSWGDKARMRLASLLSFAD